MNTRRQFLISAPLGVLVGAVACDTNAPASKSQTAPATPGAPPTFAAGQGAGPAVTPATFAEAEKLTQVTMTPAERQQAADSWRQSMAPYLERSGASTELVGIEDGVVQLKVWLTRPGASRLVASLQVKNGIERALRDAIPELRAVEAVNLPPHTLIGWDQPAAAELAKA